MEKTGNSTGWFCMLKSLTSTLRAIGTGMWSGLALSGQARSALAQAWRTTAAMAGWSSAPHRGRAPKVVTRVEGHRGGKPRVLRLCSRAKRDFILPSGLLRAARSPSFSNAIR